MMQDFRVPKRRTRPFTKADNEWLERLFVPISAEEIAAVDAADEAAMKAEEERKAHGETARPGRKSTFIMFPHMWFDRLKDNEPSGGLMMLALVLLDRANRDRSFAVTTTVMQKAGVSRNRKRDYLLRLKRLGLIAIEWRGRKAPLITPLRTVRPRG